jgi:dipeptidyl aminopeptidase/acylaminoacyl peptidase
MTGDQSSLYPLSLEPIWTSRATGNGLHTLPFPKAPSGCRTDGSDCLELSDPSRQAALPRWSPDGKHLVFMSVEGGKAWKTLIVPADGRKARQLIEGDNNEVDANWSRDGTQIVFGKEWSAKNPHESGS